jgi:peptidoglycan pentaglycine glycine transferase (the first glycine)
LNGWHRITEPGAWDATLAGFPSPHVLQTWAWGELKSRWGWQAERWLHEQDTAAFTLLRRAAGPFSVLYVPKGPVLRDLSALPHTLEALETLARKKRAIWIKLDADPPATDDIGWAERDLESVHQTLTARGWSRSASQVQFRNTALSHVGRDDDALLAAMSAKCRYNVRLAERRGVTVRTVHPVAGVDADALYALYAETAARDGFLIREKAYYVDVWRAMDATAFIAEREGEALGGIVVFAFAKRAWYFYGMSRSTGREHMPNHLLQWQAMRWARERGCTTYDWWGAPEALNEQDSMWGVWRFKESFGAAFAEGAGAWDFAPSRLLHRAYTGLMPRILAIMRRRGASASGGGDA